MKNLYIAKSLPRETIKEHTENLIRNYDILKELYPHIKYINWEILYLACLYHDLGKMNTKFQNKIIKNINEKYQENIKLLCDKFPEIEEIPHGYLSCAFVPLNYYKEIFNQAELKILYESIYRHHKREELEPSRIQDLKKIVSEDLQEYYDNFVFERLKVRESLSCKHRKYLKQRFLRGKEVKEDTTLENLFILTKGLLNKIDFAASSNIDIERKPDNLVDLTFESIKKFGFNELQEYMDKNTNENLIVRASTGIGKTEAALVWIGENKGFFTLPLKVSINAIYDRLREKIKCSKDKVALLHSDTASEYVKRSNTGDLDIDYLSSTKQLAMPLTVCTVDQLIDFIFKCEGFELKLATLAYSKIVIDEIQMYSPDLLAYLIIALAQINKIGGKFSIVTATFPSILQGFMEEVGLICGKDYKKTDEPFLKKINGKIMLRHKVKVVEENINIQMIIKDKRKRKLVIVNTIREAQRVYKELKKSGEKNVNLFHARFIKEHRSLKEKAIFEDGKVENNSFEGIWVTTQVVEASLDIDFDVLYTELSDMAGLQQRMGRVYRNRILDSDLANVYVFVGGTNYPSGISKSGGIIDIDIFTESKKCILKYDNKELDEEEKMKMIDEVYSYDALKNSDYYLKIKETIDVFKNLVPYELEKNDARLRDILSENIIPESVYYAEKEDIDSLIEKLKIEKENSKKIILKDILLKKTLSVPSRDIDRYKEKLELEVNRFEKIYVIPCQYSLELGVEFTSNNNFTETQFI